MPFVEPPSLPSFLRDELPFRRFSFELESGEDQGRRIHGIDTGPRDGTVVWMQHGNPTWCYLDRKVIANLSSERFRCIVPDLLGFGLSSKLPRVSDHSLERHQAALLQVLDQLQMEKMILVGQDWGGPMVTGIGAKRPKQVAAVVLGNTSVLAPRRPRGAAFHKLSQVPVLSDLVFQWLNLPTRFLSRVQGDASSIAGSTAKAYRWPLRKLRDRCGPLALARMVPNSREHPSMKLLQRGQDWLESFEGPMALVWGERDPILGRALRRHIETFPQASVLRTQAGHFLQEEVPQELAAAIVRVADLVEETNEKHR